MDLQTIKNHFDQTPLWDGWREGRVWRVPVYPKRFVVGPIDDGPVEPDPIPVIEFEAESAVDKRTGRKVWLFYGRHDKEKVLCHVMPRQ